MSLPALTDWTPTREGLHRAALVVGALRKALAQPEPNWLHLALRIAPAGLTTGSLPPLDEAVLDFREAAIRLRMGARPPAVIPLAGQTQATLADSAEDALAAFGHPAQLDRGKLTAAQPLRPDAAAAAAYLDVLHLVADVLGRFRSRLPGEKTPVVVWPHGFDVSFLWFATDRADESAPHMAFGFSPYSQGLERPYVYTYAYPLPDGLTDLDLPALTRWHTQGWTGTVTPYDDLRAQPDPAGALENTLEGIFARVSPRVG